MYRIVEQIGDQTFAVADGFYCEVSALLAAIDLHIDSDEEREYFVDGDDLPEPIPVR